MTEALSALARYRDTNGKTLDDLGSALGVDKSTILRWEQGRVPAERVLDVERVTGISRHVLRHDIYGPAPAKASAA